MSEGTTSTCLNNDRTVGWMERKQGPKSGHREVGEARVRPADLLAWERGSKQGPASPRLLLPQGLSRQLHVPPMDVDRGPGPASRAPGPEPG